jgi:hypothetical protein
MDTAAYLMESGFFAQLVDISYAGRQ